MKEAVKAEKAVTPDIIKYLANPKRALPKQVGANQVVGRIIDTHDADGGSTFNLYFGNLKGKKLYAVSVYPDRGRILQGKAIDPAILRAFIEENRDLLADPRNSIGTWYDADEGLTYLDVSATLPDRQLTIRLGKKYNQVGIYDLGSGRVIDTGGTGEPLPNIEAPEKRLPPLSPKKRPRTKG